MKLESLKNGKFGRISQNEMKYIVGGYQCKSGASTHGPEGAQWKSSADIKTFDDKTGEMTGHTLYGYSSPEDTVEYLDKIPGCTP